MFVNALFQPLRSTLENSSWKPQLPQFLYGKTLCIRLSKWHICETSSKLNKTRYFYLFFNTVDIKLLNSLYFIGLGERRCVYQWLKSGSLLVNWPPAISLPPWTLSQQWNQPGTDTCEPPFWHFRWNHFAKRKTNMFVWPIFQLFLLKKCKDEIAVQSCVPWMKISGQVVHVDFKSWV